MFVSTYAPVIRREIAGWGEGLLTFHSAKRHCVNIVYVKSLVNVPVTRYYFKITGQQCRAYKKVKTYDEQILVFGSLNMAVVSGNSTKPRKKDCKSGGSRLTLINGQKR